MSNNRRQNPQREVDVWNSKVSIGDTVEYRDYPGAEAEQFSVRTAAEVLSGHSSVVWLDGKRGCVCTSHCRLVSKSVPA